MEMLFLNQMNIVQLENYRQRLFLLKQEVEQSLTEDSHQVAELDQSRIGRLSRMDELQDQQLAIEVQFSLKRKLQAIEGALNRINNDDFGVCYLCDEAITDARLTFDPTVTRCLQCADKNSD
ncbi:MULTISPECIES: TraR/DksA family transcriptional regulator [unclassified Methylophaga]|jgi:RNA polymerase-binding transcription factor|uniref:TraR/DksA family transcriptional regulator n=2 Tax=Methylophaga TaxID=40222 RepID=UPI000C8A45C3|nr:MULTISPECIES: TraR/DksA C4-type zinc finger protein [unclassified Methylophaga]MAP27236.1 conjugal transfer protein TraR [Methylophaga sp.]HCO01392.1 conjugal transfer protein TraR [Methylophaga sp.]|tara:strand:+ start:103 stop:468 length:366 start_codon:yes stop_codon:yes gene_type:complete